MPNKFAICCLVFICAAGAQQAQEPTQQNQKPASVEGVVVNDLTKEPLRRAEVTLMQARPGTQMSPGQVHAAVTDAEGKFRVQDLEAGRYIVSIRRQGFVSARGSSSGSAANLQVTAGQELKGLRYALVPQAVIAGKVLDDEGEPAQGVQVMVLSQRRTRGKLTWMPVSQAIQTNDKGEYRLANIQTGKYILMAQIWRQAALEAATAQRPATNFVSTFYPGVTETGQATVVEATAGSELTGLDITLKRAPVFQVRGRVLTPEGQPAKNFHVAVGSKEGGFFGAGGQMTRIRDDGGFEMTGVPNGNWLLMVTGGRGGVMTPGDQQTTTLPIEVNNQDVEGLEVRFSLPFNLQGSIVLEAATEQQKPDLSTFSVSLIPGATTVMTGSRPARVQPDGTFTLPVNSPGNYYINTFSGAASGLYLASIKVGNEDYLYREINLSGSAAGPVKLVFRGDGGRISGTIDLPEEKRGQGGGMAVLIPADNELKNSTMGRSVRQVDQNGSFQFESVRPGEYYVVATTGSDYGAVQDIDQMKDFESKATKVKVAAGGSTSIQVKPIEPAEK
ncbi:MAG: carboxypeptidase regulatory-like domain-containing protein [Acidobacteria bacterium]|nr:carboxypeptidase regulatory-like domain-containing protein [Acidobacteriota bacterium]